MIKEMMDKKVSRKSFLKILFSAAALFSLSSLFSKEGLAVPSQTNGRPKKNIKGKHDLVVAESDDPYAATVKAVEAMGGMEKFVKKNDVVVVKPNIGWDRTPAQAGNTNPQVVAALIDMALKAGAKKVNIFDVTCNEPRRCYATSLIEKTAKEHGADIYIPEEWDTLKAHFNHPSPMEGWPILRDAIDCDVFINVPVLKHHGLTRLTLSMKNLMGVCGGNRGIIHQNIGAKLVDLTDLINPDLTVIDAYRVLLRNGPTGGSLEDVDNMKKVVVGTDPLLTDMYACSLMRVDTSEVPYVKVALERNPGVSLKKADILEIKV